MRRYKLNALAFVLSGCTMFFSSCNRLEEESLHKNDDLTLTCLQAAWTGSRAVTDEEGQGSFSEKDRIEVLLTGGKQAVTTRLEYTGGEWLPALNRKACGTGDLTLSAIYPLLPQDGNEPAWRDIAMPVDQSGAAEYEAADVLFASTEVGASSASAVLKFNHALHRINIHLKGNIPDDLTIEVKSLAGGRISLEDGTVKADGDAGFVWLKPYRQGSASYSIIILPQATEAFRGEEGLLRLTSGGKSVAYKFDSSAERFNEGMQTTLNLTLKKEEGSWSSATRHAGCTVSNRRLSPERRMFLPYRRGRKRWRMESGSVTRTRTCLSRCRTRTNTLRGRKGADGLIATRRSSIRETGTCAGPRPLRT